MKRSLWILGVLALAGALALLLVPGERSREALEPHTAENRPVGETMSVPAEAARELPIAAQDVPIDARQETLAPGSGERIALSQEREFPISTVASIGTLKVEGRLGARNYAQGSSTQWDEAGTLIVILHATPRAPKTREIMAVVEAGQFRFTAPADARLQIKSLTLDERLVILEPGDLTIVSPSDFPKQIEGKWAGQTILRVFDKGSGRELDTISVRFMMASGQRTPPEFPPAKESQLVAEVEPTPYVLPKVMSFAEDAPTRPGMPHICWVGAPNHAWQKVTIDPLVGGERLIHLVRAASLRVEIGGDRSALDSQEPTVLRLREPGFRSLQQALWSLPLNGKTTAVTTPPLPVGSWRLCLERGPAHGPETLVEETVKVIFSDEGRVVRLDLPNQSAKEGEAYLEGEIVLHRGFDETILVVRAEAIEVEGIAPGDEHARFTCTARPGEPMPYRFSLPLGRWRIHLEPIGLVSEVDLYPSGLSGVDFLPSSPARVEVRVRSKANGESLNPGQIRWRSGSASGVAGIVKANDDEPGVYEFQTLPGELELRCALRGYRYLARRVEASSGRNAFVMELERDCSVRVQFLDGETRVPWTRKHLLSVTATEGQGRFFGASGGNVLFTDEGEYELLFGDLDGFRDPDPLRVRVDCIEREKLEIQLLREY